MNIGEQLEHEWHAASDAMRHLMHPHPHNPATAPQPVTLTADAAPQHQEDPVSLTTITDDVRNDLTEGLAYVEGLVARVKAAAPGIVSTVDAVSNTTVGKLLEVAAGKILPPGIEEEFLTLAGRYFSTFGQAPAQAQPAPAAPAAPAPAQ